MLRCRAALPLFSLPPLEDLGGGEGGREAALVTSVRGSLGVGWDGHGQV